MRTRHGGETNLILTSVSNNSALIRLCPRTVATSTRSPCGTWHRLMLRALKTYSNGRSFCCIFYFGCCRSNRTWSLAGCVSACFFFGLEKALRSTLPPQYNGTKLGACSSTAVTQELMHQAYLITSCASCPWAAAGGTERTSQAARM